MTFDFTQILILVLIAILFFKEEMKSWIPRFFGLKGNSPGAGMKELGLKMDTLSGHYNHETTGLLSGILEELKWVRRDQAAQAKQLEHIITRVEEVIKYGVPSRDTNQ